LKDAVLKPEINGEELVAMKVDTGMSFEKIKTISKYIIIYLLSLGKLNFKSH